MLMDLAPTGATLSVYYGTNSSKAADATKNTMWFSKPLRGIGYNIRGTTGTLSQSSPILRSGIAGEVNNYFEHSFGSGTWSYGIEVFGVDGSSVWSVGVVDHPYQPIASINAVGGIAATTNQIAFTKNWEADSVNIYRSTTAGMTWATKGTPIATGLTSSTYDDTGLTAGTRYYYTVAGVKNGNVGPLSSELSGYPGCYAYEDFESYTAGTDYSSVNTLNDVISAGGNIRSGSTFTVEGTTNKVFRIYYGGTTASEAYHEFYSCLNSPAAPVYRVGMTLTLKFSTLDGLNTDLFDFGWRDNSSPNYFSGIRLLLNGSGGAAVYSVWSADASVTSLGVNIAAGDTVGVRVDSTTQVTLLKNGVSIGTKSGTAMGSVKRDIYMIGRTYRSTGFTTIEIDNIDVKI